MSITTVGLDADDTLWHNETIFRLTHKRFTELLADYCDEATLETRLAETERRNLQLYGYGAKGFTLSMIEAAMDLTDGAVPTRVIREVLAAGREMLMHPVEPLPGVDAALSALTDQGYRLVLITKGDLLHQEQKLAASGLGERFQAVEIVSEKDVDTYRRIFTRHGAGPEQSAMAGNSVKSDILPALQAGAYAAYVPYPLIWAHEVADVPVGHPRFVELANIADLPAWLAQQAS
jgi:putative hydrolase of the HAD superfamily